MNNDKWKMESPPTWLHVSDLDNTLLGDDAATRRYARFVAEQAPALMVAYNSSRSFESIMGSVVETDLPRPDFVIASMGTDIRVIAAAGRFLDARQRLAGWARRMSKRWSAQRVREIVAAHPGVVIQPEEFLTPYKISFYLDDASPQQLAAIEEDLRVQGIDAGLVYSSNRDLDVLPAGINKGSATRYLADAWGFSDERVIISGDSGNDQAMFDTGLPSIIVGNAQPELRAFRADHVYHARADYADGVIEGIKHWMRQAAMASPA